MKSLSKISLLLCLAIFILSTANFTFGQINYPRPSQRAHIEQTIGDTQVKITYHRPNVRERKIWGTSDEKALVPFGQVWRAGANEATTIEFSNDVTINGMELKKGKYGFYTIPTADEWTLIFSKKWNQSGAQYDQESDALRVKTTPQMVGESKESLSYSFENVTPTTATIILAWEKARIPFKVDVGDVNTRVLRTAQRQILTTPLNVANYIFSTKQSDKYEMALTLVNGSLNTTETYFGLFIKSRLLGEMDKKKEAIETAEKAIALGKEQKVNPASIAFLEGLLKNWKSEE